jgi:hypothetical protein
MGTGTSAESSPFNFYVCRRVARFAGFERTAPTSPGRVTRQNFIFASGYFTAVAGHLAHALCRRMATWKQMKEKPRSARPGASSIESMEAYCSALMAPCRTAQRCILVLGEERDPAGAGMALPPARAFPRLLPCFSHFGGSGGPKRRAC